MKQALFIIMMQDETLVRMRVRSQSDRRHVSLEGNHNRKRSNTLIKEPARVICASMYILSLLLFIGRYTYSTSTHGTFSPILYFRTQAIKIQNLKKSKKRNK